MRPLPQPALRRQCFDAIAEVVKGRLMAFMFDAITNTVLAYTTIGQASPELVDAIESGKRSFEALELSHSCDIEWALP